MEYTLCATCLFGLESLVADELRFKNFANVRAENGRVLFSGDASALARANICLRAAERVLILAGQFEAETFDQLFVGVNGIRWQDYLPENAAFPVKGSSIASDLHSIPDCQKIVKKAIAENMKKTYGSSWLKEDGAKYQIQFNILKNSASIYIDTSGEGLHKRGYRAVSNDAPIKETLASGILMIARYRRSAPLYDPMCGSGTFAVEAAMYAQNRAPGLSRAFAAEKWPNISKKVWNERREAARFEITSDIPEIFASDIDSSAIEIARENAKKAGVENAIKFSQKDINAAAEIDGAGILVTNPPYGERMLDLNASRGLYRGLGHMCASNNQLRKYIITPDSDFEKHFGVKADKKRKLYNGMIKCDLYIYGK